MILTTSHRQGMSHVMGRVVAMNHELNERPASCQTIQTSLHHIHHATYAVIIKVVPHARGKAHCSSVPNSASGTFHTTP